MKTNKIKFILVQLLFIVFINYMLLINDGFIFKTHWKPTFIFALTYYHIGTFITLYATLISKNLSSEKENFLFNFNMFFYISFIGLLLYHNCHIESNNLMENYTYGLIILFMSITILFETIASYKKYSLSLITHSKN